MKNNCWICGKEYDACLSCKQINGWRRIVCSPEHYQIHQIISEYREGIITDKEAAELFSNIGITINSELDLLGAVMRDIKDIIKKGTSKKMPKLKNKSDETVVELIQDADEK